MKLPKIEVTYNDISTEKRIIDIDALIEEYRFRDEEFSYFFEVYEDDEVVVFANVCGYERYNDEIENNEPRLFQVETAVLVKDIKNSQYMNKLYYLNDNDGFCSLNAKLSGKPVWTLEELSDYIKDVCESFQEFPYQRDWEEYV